MTANGSRDPFAVDEERALDALTLAWGDQYDEISVFDSKWSAHHKDAAEGDVITGSTPDDLNRKIRADWLRREGDVTVVHVDNAAFRGDGLRDLVRVARRR